MSELLDQYIDVAEKLVVERLGWAASGYDPEGEKRFQTAVHLIAEAMTGAYNQGKEEGEISEAVPAAVVNARAVHMSFTIAEARAVFAVLGAVRRCRETDKAHTEPIWRADAELEEVER